MSFTKASEPLLREDHTVHPSGKHSDTHLVTGPVAFGFHPPLVRGMAPADCILKIKLLDTECDTHTSNLDFQLTQLSQWEKRRWNGKVERSAESVLFNTGFTTSANGGSGQQLLCSGKPVCGESIMWNHHESKRAD